MNQQKVNELIDQTRKPSQYLDLRTLVQKINESDYKFDKDEVLDIIKDFQEGLTPNKVSELIAIIGEHYQPKSIIDICCGIGNILSYFKNKKTIKGIDVNAGSIEIAEYINPNANFIIGDTLNYDFNNEKYDLVIGHFPFGVKIPDRKLLEIELIDIGLKLLNINGVAIFVVADSILTSSNKYLSEFRKKLLAKYSLDMVISLPLGIFPYVGVKTSILVVRNGEHKHDIFMPNFEDNPFDLVKNFRLQEGDFYLPLSKVTDRLDRNHYVPLGEIEEIKRGHVLIKLSAVSDIISGKYLDRVLISSNGEYSIFNKKGKSGKNSIDSIPDEKCILKDNDIVVSLCGGKSSNEVFIYKETNIKTVIPKSYAIIRPREYKEYLAKYLQTKDWKTIIQPYLKNTVLQNLNVQDLKNIEIPLLSDEELIALGSKTMRGYSENSRYIKQSFINLEKQDFKKAEENIERAFENVDSEIMEHKEVYFKNIVNTKKLDKTNKALEQEIKQKETAHKALHEKEKEMLSFFTHTMRNALSTAPESLRQAIRLLGSEDYETDKKHYKAINKIAALFSTLSLTDCLIDTFKQSINEPEEFQRAWRNDNSGDATPIWVIASALRQSLNRIIFMSDTSELRQLLNSADTPAIIATRKSFIENILPLNLDSQGIASFYSWLNQIDTLEISIEENSSLHFGVNQVKFSLLFAITSELLLNALKYWDGTGKILVSWQLEQDYFIFRVTNPCLANASSNLAGTHKGLAFIKRLVELLGEQAIFTPIAEEDSFTAEFKLHQSLLEDKA